MPIKIGEVGALFRYPVKSMAGESLQSAELGWHGVEGDRRLALRRIGDHAGFPFLTASKLPELILFTPQRREPDASSLLPTHVRTPEGQEFELFSEELAHEVGRRHGSPVEILHFDRGIFDEASLSLISSATVSEVARLAGQQPDVRRFRPNLVIEPLQANAFEEDGWVEGQLSFGTTGDGPVLGVTNRDERCAMVNFDPDSARATPELLKSIVRERDNKAGVYGTVMRRGRVEVGQPIYFEPAAERGKLQ